MKAAQTERTREKAGEAKRAGAKAGAAAPTRATGLTPAPGRLGLRESPTRRAKRTAVKPGLAGRTI